MNIKAIFAVLWAIIGIASWTFFEWRGANSGTIVEFEIEGYDPRDLLSGHYVTYRVNYGEQKICEQNPNDPTDSYPTEHCVCLKPDSENRLAIADSAERCNQDSPPSCRLWMKGYCNYSGRFEANIERFYIPEAYSQYLMTIPEDATIFVNITSSGRAMVKELRIAGDSLENFIAKKRIESLSQSTSPNTPR